MTNYEKYKDEIIKADKESRMRLFIETKVPKARTANTSTYKDALFYMWLQEEYKEPEVDWTKVKVDTKILVRNRECDPWRKRYFAKYENGLVYTFDNGATSWACDKYFSSWAYAELVEEGE